MLSRALCFFLGFLGVWEFSGGFMLFLRALLVLRFVLGGLKTLKFFGLYCKRPDFSDGFFLNFFQDWG